MAVRARVRVRAADSRVVGSLPGAWVTRTGAERYLPDLPAGESRGQAVPPSAACIPGVVPLLSEWLDRELAPEPAGAPVSEALAGAVS